MRKARWASAVCCALLALFILASLGLRLSHDETHCHLDGCLACAAIRLDEALLRLAIPAAAAAAVLHMLPRGPGALALLQRPPEAASTLVSLKIKMTK